MQGTQLRSQMDEKYLWKLEDMFENNEKWEESFAWASAKIAEASTFEGRLGSAQGLLCAMVFTEECSLALENLFTYARMRRDEDNGNGLYQGMTDRAMSLLIKYDTATAFFTPELLALGADKVMGFLQEEPKLETYRRFLSKQLRMAPHTLSPALEKLLAASGELADAPDTIYSMLTDADMRFPTIKDENGNDVEITHGRYVPLLESHNRQVRKDAFEGLYSSYKAFANTITASFSASVKKDLFYSQARNYPSTLEATLFPNAIPPSVYDALIEGVHRHLPAFHRYVSLRKKALGVDKLHFYDVYVQIVPELKLGMPYEQAKALVLDGLKPLGERYLADMSAAFTDRWIDVYENQGKTSGAYSWGTYSTHPYVLLNYNENLDSIFTLAHELGHAMHSFYSNKSNPYIHADYPLFLAEIASTTNEALLLDHMMNTLTEKGQLMALYNHELEQIKGTVFRQTMFAEFERCVHKMAQGGEALTKDALCKVYADLNRLYFGDDIEVDENIAMEWMRIPHFYRAFYVYQYATGYSAAVAFKQSLLHGGEDAKNKYLGFLQAGGSKDPLDILKDAGLDMTDPMVVEQCMQSFETALAKLEALMEE